MVSFYIEDDEAFSLWKKIAGLSEDKIIWYNPFEKAEKLLKRLVLSATRFT